MLHRILLKLKLERSLSNKSNNSIDNNDNGYHSMTCSKVLRRDLTNFSCLTKLGRKRGIVFFLDQIRNSKVPNSSLKKENTNCTDFITLNLKGALEILKLRCTKNHILPRPFWPSFFFTCSNRLFWGVTFFHYDFKLKRDPLFNQFFLFLFHNSLPQVLEQSLFLFFLWFQNESF